MPSAKRKKSGLWVHVILIGACVASVFPLLRVFTVSLRPGDRILSTDFELFPDQMSWDHYINVFQETSLLTWIVNSIVITGLTSVIAVALAATCAYGLSRYRFPGKQKMLVFLMATQMIPTVLLLLPLYFMLKRANLVDTYAGMVVVYAVTTLPFSIWLLKGYFDTIPLSLEQAAMVDGLTEVGCFWRVVLPLSTPALAIAVLFCVTQVWNEYIVARVVLQSSELYTWPLGLFELQGDFDTKWGLFSAASVVVTVPVTMVFLYSSKWLLSGLTMGGVKG